MPQSAANPKPEICPHQTPGVRKFSCLCARRSWVLLFFLLASACGNAEKERAKIAEIQTEADERVSKAERETRERVLAAEKQVDAMKAELANATAKFRADADEAVNKAQAGAEQESKAAIAKARQAYKEEGRSRLSGLNKEATELNSKLAKAPAKVKTSVDKFRQQIATLQKDIVRDISAFDTATLDTFKKVKAKLDQDLAALKVNIHAARAKLP